MHPPPLSFWTAARFFGEPKAGGTSRALSRRKRLLFPTAFGVALKDNSKENTTALQCASRNERSSQYVKVTCCSQATVHSHTIKDDLPTNAERASKKIAWENNQRKLPERETSQLPYSKQPPEKYLPETGNPKARSHQKQSIVD